MEIIFISNIFSEMPLQGNQPQSSPTHLPVLKRFGGAWNAQRNQANPN
ncbi:hypothetical protein SynROS8604_01081 [Synechococcus sp. ROS8604]|nr:hypothetical protein SynROS8604_01081 [Synechococcus sp. ROS8604]